MFAARSSSCKSTSLAHTFLFHALVDLFLAGDFSDHSTFYHHLRTRIQRRLTSPCTQSPYSMQRQFPVELFPRTWQIG
jgi:hypothetical protein